MIEEKNYEIIYSDPFTIKTTVRHIPQFQVIGSNIIKGLEKKERRIRKKRKQ